MKPISFFLLLLLGISLSAQESLHQYYGDDKPDSQPAVSISGDGGFVIAGKTETATDPGQASISKFDTQGKMQWTKIFGTAAVDAAQAVLLCSDKNILVAGVTDDEPENSRDITLCKFSTGGNLMWARRYSNPGSDNIVGLVEMPDGGYVMSGSVDKLQGLLVVKIDPLGEILWQTVFKHKSSIWGNQVHAFENDKVLVTGSFDEGPFGKHDSFLTAIDKNGKQVWTKVYGEEGNDAFHSISLNNTGEILLAGNTWSWANNITESFLVKLSKTSELQWSKVLKAHPQGNRTFSAVPVGSKGFIAIANHSLKNSNGAAYIFGINNNGKLTWEHTYGGNARTNLKDLCVWNQQFLAVGNTTDFGAGDQDFYMVSGSLDGKKTACKLSSNDMQLRNVKTKVLNFNFEASEGKLLRSDWKPTVEEQTGQLKEICDPEQKKKPAKAEDKQEENSNPKLADKDQDKKQEPEKSGKTNLDQIDLTFTDNKIPDRLGDRKVETSKTIIVEQETLDILVWDNNKVDGDTISLYINGTWVLRNYALKKRKKRVIVKLTKDANNYLVLFAHNEGKQPPNTAALEVKYGKNFRRRVGLTSNMKKSGAVRFVY